VVVLKKTMNVIRSSSRLTNLLSAGVRSGQIHQGLSHHPLQLLVQTSPTSPHHNAISAKYISTFYTSLNHLQPAGLQQSSTDEDIAWSSSTTSSVTGDKGTLKAVEGQEGVPKTEEEPRGDGKPSDAELKRIGNLLIKETAQLLTKKPDYSLYSPNIVLEDNIRNKVVVGGLQYINQISLATMYLHFRYVYARIVVDSVAADFDESAVVIKWSVTGMGMLKLLIRYIPRKLWRRKNMEANADHVASGVSTYYVRDSLVVKHILDVREIDRDKVKATGTVEQIKAKVAKLKPNVPAPAMYKKVSDESPDKSTK